MDVLQCSIRLIFLPILRCPNLEMDPLPKYLEKAYAFLFINTNYIIVIRMFKSATI